MAKLSQEEQAQLDALKAKSEAPDEPDDDDDDGDDGGIVVLRGKRADSFLAHLTGPVRPAKKKTTAGKPDEETAETGETGEGETVDPPPPAGHRYFRTKA